MSPGVQVTLPPAGSRVILEGGYYTIRPATWSAPTLEGPRMFYMEVEADTPPLSFEVVRRAITKEAGRVWVVLAIPENQHFKVPDDVACSHVMTFDPPTSSELQSFRTAMEVAAELQANGNHVTFALLVGDLALPPELRHDIEWVLPASYREKHASANETVLLTESRCRAVAARLIVTKARKTLKSVEETARMYVESGCSVFEDAAAEDGTLYLAADVLLDRRLTAGPVIALTKGATRPACATTIAGKLRALLRDEDTPVYHVAWYDTADDPDIRNKNLEAFVVTACFFGGLHLDSQIVTTDHGRVTHVDHLTTADVRTRGVRSGYQDLLLATDREGRHYGIDFVLSGVTSECCVYRKPSAAISVR